MSKANKVGSKGSALSSTERLKHVNGPSKAGAEEYDEIIRLQEMMEKFSEQQKEKAGDIPPLSRGDETA